jgi:hypothetical protein
MKDVAEQMHFRSVKLQPELPMPATAGACYNSRYFVSRNVWYCVGKRPYSALRQARQILTQGRKGQSNDGGGDG